MTLPLDRLQEAFKKNVHRNILFVVAGGIGDEVCAEPTLRFALDKMTESQISLAAYHPELFGHLKFKEVFTLGKDEICFENYYRLDTFPGLDRNFDPFHEIVSTYECNGVDFSSLSALRCQLPLSYRTPQPFETKPDLMGLECYLHYDCVFVHCGNSWPSKTFSFEWWDEFFKYLGLMKLTPVLIGQNTIQVACVGWDLRDRLTLPETVYLLNRAPVLITNDSAPLHLAAAGQAHIGFIPTIKHPDFLLHHRLGGLGWRMHPFYEKGAWQEIDHNPPTLYPDIVNYRPKKMPEPTDVVNWVKTRTF